MVIEFDKSKNEERDTEASSSRMPDVIGGLLRHWKLGLLTVVVVLAIGIPYAWKKGTAEYRAEGVLYVSPRNWRNLESDQEQDLQSNSQFREFMQQQVRTINRYDIVLPVVKDEAPGALYFRLPTENERRAADRLRAQLDIAAVPDTYQITVGLTGPKAEGLAEIVNSVMEQYVATARKEMFYDSDSRIKNLEQEKAQVKADITKVIEERTKIAESLGTTLFNGSVINNYEKQAGMNMDALMEARRTRMAAESALAGNNPKDPIETSIEALASDQAQKDTVLSVYRGVLSQRKADLLMKIQGLSPQHAGRIAAEKDIAAIESEMDRATQEMRKMAADNYREIQRGKVAQSKHLETMLTRESNELKQKALEYSLNYQRSLELGEEVERLRKRLNATEDRISSLQLETKAPGFVRIFSPALPPDIPVKGGRKKLLMMAFLAAVLLGLALPVGLDYMDPSVRSISELEAVLELPSSGWLPKMGHAFADEKHVLRLALVIRGHLEELTSGALVMTGIRHGSGASTLCLALGKALDSLGVRTLVIEVNHMTPDERYVFGNGKHGLSEWMTGRVSFEECVNPANKQWPDRIGTGHIKNEVSLMADPFIERLVEEARKTYSLVIIDAPPVTKSLLTEELIREMNSVMLVTHARVDNRKEIKEVMKTIERLCPRTFGSVLNQVHGPSWKKKNDSSSVLVA